MNLNWRLIRELEDIYGDSFYILESSKFENNYESFLSEFKKIYSKVNIAYSYKTNYLPVLCSIVNKKGGYAEVVSDMEYDLAIKVGVNPKNIIVNGPYKTKNHLKKFLLNGSLVNLDSYSEIKYLKEIIKENKCKRFNIGLRCNFRIDESISRFGFDVLSSQFSDLMLFLENQKDNINLKCIHSHFPNRDLDSFEIRVTEMLKILKNVFKDYPFEMFDIGGGYFGKVDDYLKSQFNCKVPEYSEYAKIIASKVEEYFKGIDYKKKPTLILEPGSALVGDTMKFITKVIDIKKIQGKKIATSSASKFNMGLLNSEINLPMKVYSKDHGQDKDAQSLTDVVGYTCIESDYLYRGYKGDLNLEDYLVFSNVGSYSFVFKPPFINPNVAILNYDSDFKKFELIKKVETFEYIFDTFIFK